MTLFSSDVLANLVGSFVGVGLAFLIDRSREATRRRDRLEKRRRQAEEGEAEQLRIIQWAVEENVELANQAIIAIDGRGLFFFRMNTHLLDSAILALSTLSTDQTLLWRAEHFRYQLHHLNEKLRAWTDAAIYQGDPTQAALTLVDRQVLPSARKQLAEVILPKAADLLPSLHSRIQMLSRVQKPPVRPAFAVPDEAFHEEGPPSGGGAKLKG